MGYIAYFHLLFDFSIQILYYYPMTETMNKDEINQLLAEAKTSSGKIKISHPALGSTFPNPVPFTLLKNNRDQCFIFLFEPHNERSLTNAIEPTICTLLKALYEAGKINLTKELAENLEIHRDLRIFQEDSTGRIDEVLFKLNFGGGVTYGEITHQKVVPGLPLKQAVVSRVNITIENIRWRALTKNLLKNMKLFDLKN